MTGEYERRQAQAIAARDDATAFLAAAERWRCHYMVGRPDGEAIWHAMIAASVAARHAAQTIEKEKR